MAVATLKQMIAPTALSATLTTTLYTVPSSTTAIVKEIEVCNTESSALTYSLFVGTSATVANCIADARSIAPGETQILTYSKVLVAADQIRGGASAANAVSINASGVQVA